MWRQGAEYHATLNLGVQEGGTDCLNECEKSILRCNQNILKPQFFRSVSTFSQYFAASVALSRLRRTFVIFQIRAAGNIGGVLRNNAVFTHAVVHRMRYNHCVRRILAGRNLRTSLCGVRFFFCLHGSFSAILPKKYTKVFF